MRKGYFILLLSILGLSVLQAGGWGFDIHREMGTRAIGLLPEEWRDFFGDYEQEIREASVAPDQRRSSDPTEGPRHYDDQDDPHQDRNVSSKSSDYRKGVVSWAVDNSTDLLIDALVRDDLDDIIRYAGDVSHYVGDASQPLHSTVNYDGQDTGNNGIHSRYEAVFTGDYFDQLFSFSSFAALRVVDDPYQLIEEQISSGLAVVPDIMRADDKAYKADPSRGSEYYRVLYDELGEMTKGRFKLGIQNIANLWYTALVKSGRYVVDQTSSTQSEPNLQNSSTTDIVSQPSSTTSSTVPYLPYVGMILIVIIWRRLRNHS